MICVHTLPKSLTVSIDQFSVAFVVCIVHDHPNIFCEAYRFVCLLTVSVVSLHVPCLQIFCSVPYITTISSSILLSHPYSTTGSIVH
jgi:hypothetical protein